MKSKNCHKNEDQNQSDFAWLRTIWVLFSERKKLVALENSSLQFHEEAMWNERLRQAQMSFNLIFILTATTALLYLIGIYFFWTSQISEGKFSTVMSLSSSVVSIGCFQLNRDANERLDNLVKDFGSVD